MRVTSLGVWVILIAVTILLAWFTVWGIAGTVIVADDTVMLQEVNPITFIINWIKLHIQ